MFTYLIIFIRYVVDGMQGRIQGFQNGGEGGRRGRIL